MKLKLQILIVCFLILTSYTAKSQNIITGYNDNDVQKMQTFFTQTDGTTTNGVKINSGYSSTDPTTWTGITWNTSNPKRITNITVKSKNLFGSLNCSSLDSLTFLDCSDNKLIALNISTNTALRKLYCYTNKITVLDISKNTALTNLNCSDNQLKSLDASGDTVLTTLSCNTNQLNTLNVIKNIALTSLICYDNELKFSDIQYNSRRLGVVVSSPQRPFIPIGVDTANNSMSAIGGDTINLSSEVNVGFAGRLSLTTFNIWKKANDGTINEITNTCVIDSGKIILPNTYTENDSIFITMSNPYFPNFTTQTTPIIPDARTMQTVIFKLLTSSAVLPTENNGLQTIKIYPNPANNYISVTGNEEDLNSVRIYNSLGKDVTKYTNYSVSNTKQKQIDISKLTTGIYIIKTKNTTNKLIVK